MSELIPAAEPDFAAFIGIDWADREHAWALELSGGSRREKGTLEQRPEAIEEWAQQLAARFPGRPVAVALEQSRGALLYALCKYPHLVLYPVHPYTSHSYRKAIFPSGSKDDPRDAGALLDLLLWHRSQLRPLRQQEAAIRKVQILVEKRRDLVDLRTAQTNRIAAELKLCFPQVLDWFDQLNSPMVVDFLLRWPTLEQLRKEPRDMLRTFFVQHGSRSSARIDARLEQIDTAQPLLNDSAILDSCCVLIQSLLPVVAALNQAIRRLEDALEQTASAHPDFSIFRSFPGAGPALAPRLLAAFGSDRDRYRSAAELQAFSGTAPVIESCGSSRWIHFRRSCPKFLRQTFHEFAAQSIPHCQWAAEFYQRHKAKGKRHHAIIRSLAFKWIRILFRCWQSKSNYQDSLYHAAPALPTPLSSNAPSAGRNPVNNSLQKLADLLKTLPAIS